MRRGREAKKRSWALSLAAVMVMLVVMVNVFAANVWADGEIKITYQTADISAMCGDTVEFKVVATGTGTLKYQWQSRKGSDAEWSNSALTGAKTPTLTMTAIGGLSGWDFRCVITDEYGHKEYSETDRLTVWPVIQKAPQDAYVEPGNVAKFSVTAAGAGPLTYQWQSRKDFTCAWANSGQAGAKTATLSVSSLAGLNGWQFRCVVTDKNGLKAYSNYATLTTQFAITSLPSEKKATAGTTAYFQIKATGKAPLTYQWQSRKNASSAWTNSGQQGAKTATLAVATSAGLHGWQFRCVVTDGSGKKKYSNASTLNIIPTITVQPKDKTVKAGNTATFTVEATGAAPLKYQWQSRKNASSEWTNSGQSGAKTQTLSVASLGGLDGWQFRCLVTDKNGQTAASVTVTLTVLPAIKVEPHDIFAEAGSTGVFSITVDAAGPLTYQWQSRKDFTCAWANSGQSGAKTKRLSVASQTGLDGWQFRCIVTDRNGNKAYSNYAVLKSVYKFTTQPVNTSAAAGDVARFQAVASGASPISYQWQARESASGTWADYYTSSTLSFTTRSNMHGWQFRCVATDASGKKLYSNVATLSLYPRFIDHPKSKSAEVGGYANFGVYVQGSETLTYRWQERKDASSPWEDCDELDADTSVVRVKTRVERHNWQYRCIVTDGNGQSNTSEPATLTVLSAIITQPREMAVAVVNMKCELTVKADGFGPFQYQWEYQDAGSEAWIAFEEESAKTDSYLHVISFDDIGRSFRCAVRDATGRTMYSKTVKYKILPRFTKNPESVKATVGQTVTFSAEAAGEGPLTYQWYYYSPAIGEWRLLGSASIDKKSIMVFVSEDKANYKYRCVVTDANNLTSTSTEATLTLVRT